VIEGADVDGAVERREGNIAATGLLQAGSIDVINVHATTGGDEDDSADRDRARGFRAQRAYVDVTGRQQRERTGMSALQSVHGNSPTGGIDVALEDVRSGGDGNVGTAVRQPAGGG